MGLAVDMVAVEGEMMIPLSSNSVLNLINSSACLIIDCRSFIAFNTAHIRTAVNMNFSPLLKRRLQRGTVTLESLISCSESRQRLKEGHCSAVVIYDENTREWSDLDHEGTMRTIYTLLRRDRKRNLYFLKGGFDKFSSQFPQMCDFASPQTNAPCTQSTVTSDSPQDTRASCPTVRSKPEQGNPVEILDFLYLGSAAHSAQKDILDRLGITSIMNVSRNIPNSFEDSFEYKTIPVDDTYSADISQWFNEAIEFIDAVRESGGRVLVHCQAGISRSATICLAYLISRMKYKLDEAYEYVKKRRSVISPNFNFMGQLLSWESENGAQDTPHDHAQILDMDLGNDSYAFLNFHSYPCSAQMINNGQSRSPSYVTTPT